MNNGLTGLTFQNLVIDPLNTDVIYAAHEGGALFRSSNGGADWSEINAEGIGMLAFTLDPTNPEVMQLLQDLENFYSSGEIYKAIPSAVCGDNIRTHRVTGKPVEIVDMSQLFILLLAEEWSQSVKSFSNYNP